MRAPQNSTLFPYTTLFRSLHEAFHVPAERGYQAELVEQRGVQQVRNCANTRGARFDERQQFLEKLARSEEHTSELQSRRDLVCRLLLEKKKYTIIKLHRIN